MTTTSRDVSLDEAYGALGLAPDCSDMALQSRFRALAKQLHPDVNPDPATAEIFRSVEQGYRLIVADRRRMSTPDGPDSAEDDAGARAACVQRAVARIARLLPDATPTPLAGTATAWRFRVAAGPLVEDAMLVHDATDDRYGIASIATTIDGRPIPLPAAPWTRPCATGFLPLTPDGCHAYPEALTGRLANWLARVAWVDHQLGPDPWDPRTDLARWANGQLSWVLPLLGVPATDDVERLVRDEVDGLASLAQRNPVLAPDSVRDYLHQMVSWLLTLDVAAFD